MGFRRSKRRGVPGLNTTSTADISFILLVFFLVISSMDSNKGIFKQLPPPETQNTEEVTDMDSRNVLEITIGTAGDIRVDGRQTDPQLLGRRVEEFVEHCPDRATHVVSVRMLPQSKYDDYFRVEDALTSAYASLRGAAARKLYRRPYADCSAYERRTIDKLYPQRVMESMEGEDAGRQENRAETDN